MRGAPILTAAGMRAAEQAAVAGGTPEYALMERAGAAAAEIIWRVGHRRDALILCGPGNNGGDGFVIARLLAARGVPVRVATIGESRTESSREARSRWGGAVEPLATAAPAAQLVDALFGAGLTRQVEPAVAARLRMLTEAAQFSYAIDLPSGIETDSGRLLSDVPDFGVTIALGALKPAHLLYPAAAAMGRVIEADIGLASVDAPVRRLAPADLRAPEWDAHKYRRGLVAVVEGAMPGAAMLAASAAAHGGAGYVKLVGLGRRGRIPLSIVQTGDEAALADERIAAVLVGPGLGRGTGRVADVLAEGHAAVVDADGLIGLDLSLLPKKAILTPHDGEFRALFGALPGSKIDRALAAAAKAGAVVVYKGPDTVIAAPDGRCAVAVGASSWLSTAGTGDVLAGLCAARLAVTGDAFRGACEAVWLHGEAARRAGAAFVADDLIQALPASIASRL
jgi:hydroxyethylthiazole kinase-like uncharacterized protein yjeF